MLRTLPAAVLHEAGSILVDDRRLWSTARRGAPILALLLLLVLIGGSWPDPGDPARDLSGAVTGHDLSQVWVAGRTALAGRGPDVYDLSLHAAAMRRAFGLDAPVFGWHYPPVQLLPAALLAALPYLLAVPLWALLSLAALAAALRVATGRRDVTLVALAHPFVFLALSYGQNAAFTAALLTAGLALLDRRPAWAGVLFGLGCYKPQLAALAPFLCLLAGRPVPALSAALTAAALAAVSLALFGSGPWEAFLLSLPATRDLILRDAAAGLDLNASAFGAARLLGASMEVAGAVQAAVAATALLALVRLWRRPADPRLRSAGTLLATALVSPYVPVYDLLPLVPASALLALAAAERGGLTPAERVFLLGMLAASPALRAATAATGLPIGFALAGLGFVLVLRRAEEAVVT